MNSNHPASALLAAVLLSSCVAANSHAEPLEPAPPRSDHAHQDANTGEDRQDRETKPLLAVNDVIVLPVYVPPSRGQVSVRSAAATRGGDLLDTQTVCLCRSITSY